MSRLISVACLCVLSVLVLCHPVLGGESGAITIKNIQGRGANRQLALADAFRNAISQALGTYVVTSRKWDGETLDKKIFDNSDAVVKTYRVVDESEKNRKCVVVIDAEIVRNEMMKYIRKEATTKVGEGELANLLAKRQAIDNAVRSLDLLFQNWRENVYRAEKYGNISIAADDESGSDTVRLSIPFIITFRWDAYSIFLDKVRNVLSRIAIDKEFGEYNKKRDDNFQEKNFSFYNKLGLLKKDNNGCIKKAGNPNGYGEVRIVFCLADDNFRYELYIVPNQVKQKLDQILMREAEVRFSLQSKGGDNIASRSVTGEVYSFGWDWICEDEISLGWSGSSGMQLITIMDAIKTELGTDSWSNHRLYHASIPVPLAAASRISGCTIKVCHPSDKEDCLRGSVVTVESMNIDEWIAIDRKPSQSVPAKKNFPQKTLPKQDTGIQHATVQKSSEVTIGSDNSSLGLISFSEKDKGLKARVLELCRLPPDTASAKKWFALTKDIESSDFRQAVFKVIGAALIFDKNNGTYNSKIRKWIIDATTFENSFRVTCADCNGGKSKARKCSACYGSGVCKYANCKEGVHLVRGFIGRGGDHYERCSKCLGSGVCQNCKGEGTERIKCPRCRGEGRIFSKNAVSQSYYQLIKSIANSFQ